MMQLTPFKINTSKKSCHFRIALILNDFKPIRINTSTISPLKPPRINTSKKHGGGSRVRPYGVQALLEVRAQSFGGAGRRSPSRYGEPQGVARKRV